MHWWPSLDKDLGQLSANCEAFTWPSETLLRQSYNIGPCRRVRGIEYVDILRDLWRGIAFGSCKCIFEIARSKGLKHTSTADSLIKHHLFIVWGLCQEIVTDNGSQFTADEFFAFCLKWYNQHIRTAPGHPQCNVQAEPYVDTVETAITKGMNDGRTPETALSNFVAEYCTTVHGITGKQPCELLLNRKLRTLWRTEAEC